MQKMVPGALAGVAAAVLLAAPALAGPTVTVRVEGEHATLLERTRVTLPDTDTFTCGNGGAHSVADALDLATGGNWDRQALTQTILGERHAFDNSDYWALWNRAGAAYAMGQVGACDQTMAEGQEALFLVDVSPPPTFAPTRFPLDLRGLPAAVAHGAAVPVSVVTFAADGTATPVAGATVSGGGASAVTAADGRAVLAFTQPGAAVVKASKAGSVVSAGERVTIGAPGAPPPAPPTTSGGRDTTAPTVTLAGIKDGKVYRRKRAPRLLRGTVSADPSGLKSVRLSIARKRGKRCWSYDGARERFRRHRCGGAKSFRVGDEARWSYLLPRRLGPGRYTIRVIAIDNAGNAGADETRLRVR